MRFWFRFFIFPSDHISLNGIKAEPSAESLQDGVLILKNIYRSSSTVEADT